MNPMEEMEKYGVKKVDPCEACTKKTWAECQACPKFEADPVYPPFTLEKQSQLELLCMETVWYKGSTLHYFVTIFDDKQYIHHYQCQEIDIAEYSKEEALAKLLVALKNDLDNGKIKEILEG